MKREEQDDSEFEEYFGGNSIVIEKPGVYTSLLNHEDCDIHALLSTNYEELYLIHTGYNQIRLPPLVDFKYESNIEKNDYKLLRNYTLILNLVKPKETALIFCERYFPVIEDSYIILLKEFKIDYQDFTSSNCNIFKLDETKRPLISSKKPLHIYFAFEKDAFMKAWSDVQLGEIKHNSPIRTFYYPSIEKKYSLPIISVVKIPVPISPLLYDRPKMPILGSFTPQYLNTKDLSQFRLTPLLPPPLIEQAASQDESVGLQYKVADRELGEEEKNEAHISQQVKFGSSADAAKNTSGKPVDGVKPIFKNNSLYPKNLTSTKKKP